MSKYQGVSTLEVLEGANNYNRWIADTVMYDIQSPVLEVGAGTGNITSYLTKVKSVYATDVDSQLVKALKSRFSDKKNIHCLQLDILSAPQKSFRNFFSSIVGVNVLEHIEADRKALKNMHSMVKERGTITLLVPAKKFAYTRLDKEIGHYRRYEKGDLKKKIEEAGFVVDDMFYFNIVGLLSWIVRDKIEGKNIHLKPYQIAIFDSIVPLLRKAESLIRPFVGISLIVYARKK